jgi:hypothetical protein
LNEPVGDNLSGAMFVEGQFGVRVQVVTNFNHGIFGVV